MRVVTGCEPDGATVLYHCTDAAETILREGFRDGEGSYLFIGATLRGVFVSDVPPDCNEGAKGDQFIEVTLDDGVDLEEFEIVEPGKPYREWCIPAELLNTRAYLRVLSEDERPRRW